MYEMSFQSRFDARYWMLGAGAKVDCECLVVSLGTDVERILDALAKPFYRVHGTLSALPVLQLCFPVLAVMGNCPST